MPVTASILYDLVQCPQRVALDAFGDPAARDEINPFVRLLWEKGTQFEHEIIAGLEQPFLDLSGFTDEEKERLTVEAMRRGEALIYGGRISAGDLLGEPDLLRKETGGYVPGDIKSGAGLEGASEESDGNPVQTAGRSRWPDTRASCATLWLERNGNDSKAREEISLFFTSIHGSAGARAFGPCGW